MGRPVLIPGSEGAGGRPGVNADALSLVIDPDQAVIPAGPDFLTHQPVRHRVEGPGHFHMAVGMDGAGAHFEEAEALLRQGLERRFLHFQEVGIHLLAGRPMDTHPGYGAVPVLEEGSPAPPDCQSAVL